MKLHTRLTSTQVYQALNAVKADGNATDDIEFVRFESGNSRTHPHRFEIQLGTEDQHSGPTNSRHYKNTGQWGASSAWNGYPIWAATWNEWGWFIAEIFRMDPTASFGPQYRTEELFHKITVNQFRNKESVI